MSDTTAGGGAVAEPRRIPTVADVPADPPDVPSTGVPFQEPDSETTRSNPSFWRRVSTLLLNSEPADLGSAVPPCTRPADDDAPAEDPVLSEDPVLAEDPVLSEDPVLPDPPRLLDPRLLADLPDVLDLEALADLAPLFDTTIPDTAIPDTAIPDTAIPETLLVDDGHHTSHATERRPLSDHPDRSVAVMEPPSLDDELAHDLRLDLDASLAFETSVSPTSDDSPGTDTEADLLAVIARGHEERRASAQAEEAGPVLDLSIESLRVVPISKNAGARLLPADAITINLADGLVGAVAIARAGTTDFVGDRHCERWGITADMILSVARTNTQQHGEISLDTVLVDGAETLVFESDLPIAAAALAWLDEFVETPLPVGALVLIPSSYLMVVQPSRARSEEAAQTLTAFASAEAGRGSDLMPSTMLLQTIDGLRVVGDLGSAAGRLGMAVATERLIGA